MKAALAYLVFPVVFGGSLAATWAGLALEFHGSVVVFVVSVSAGVMVTLSERLAPFKTEWSADHGDVPTDVAYAVSSLIAAPRIFDALALAALLPLAGSLSWGVVAWPNHWAWGLQLVLAIIVGEFCSYWWHRLLHRWPPLFRFHATHHSAPRLYWLNATRFHPLDSIPLYALHLVPLTLIGVGEPVLVGFTVWSLVHGFFQHANVDLRLGPLNYFFSMAELHRWHHSRELAEANHNYGQNVIFWDLVFGTFYWPRDREPPEAIGLPGLAAFPMTYLRQLASPFTFGRIRRASEGRADDPSRAAV